MIMLLDPMNCIDGCEKRVICELGSRDLNRSRRPCHRAGHQARRFQSAAPRKPDHEPDLA
jgi:hypothetical protein